MKLICLNTWGARVGESFFEFPQKHAIDTDIFCLQEVWSSCTNSLKRLQKGQVVNQLQRISAILPHHVPIFCPFETNVNNYDGSDPTDTSFGVALFIRSEFVLQSAGECFVFRGKNTMIGTDATTLGRNIQHATIKVGNKNLNIFNFHGLWTGNGKTDTPERITQSQKSRAYIDQFEGPKIVAGDFNLLPNTKSFHIFSEGMVDLNYDYHIINTRSSYYGKETKFADYILTTKDVHVNKYQVLADEVSDHLPLQLDFDL